MDLLIFSVFLSNEFTLLYQNKKIRFKNRALYLKKEMEVKQKIPEKINKTCNKIFRQWGRSYKVVRPFARRAWKGLDAELPQDPGPQPCRAPRSAGGPWPHTNAHVHSWFIVAERWQQPERLPTGK